MSFNGIGNISGLKPEVIDCIPWRLTLSNFNGGRHNMGKLIKALGDVRRSRQLAVLFLPNMHLVPNFVLCAGIICLERLQWETLASTTVLEMQLQTCIVVKYLLSFILNVI